MLKACYTKYMLRFKEPSGTSRGVLTEKETYFVKIWEEGRPDVYGIGECALFRGLSAEDSDDYEQKLCAVCFDIDKLDIETLREWSSIRFGVEMAMADLRNGGRRVYFPSFFTDGTKQIEINGLIWMGDKQRMQQRIQEKLEAGFHCIKLKIGAIDFEAELDLLRAIRRRFSRQDIELRVDANGAFAPDAALGCIERLADFDLHSIEQPIRQGQWEAMRRLCAVTPVPIALDEELIGVFRRERKKILLEEIRPQYIVLKPALAGGFQGASEWIEEAGKLDIKWWVTSALESNIGLNALAQWTYGLENELPQGLGTGQLYVNNIPSPLRQQGCHLYTDIEGVWDIRGLKI